MKKRFFMILITLLAFGLLIAGCVERPKRSNPFDPLNPFYLSNTGIITGKILVSPIEVRPISGANISAQQQGVEKGSAISESDGRYLIIDLPEGTYDLWVTATGYETRIVKGITVTAGTLMEINIVIYPVTILC